MTEIYLNMFFFLIKIYESFYFNFHFIRNNYDRLLCDVYIKFSYQILILVCY